MKADSADVVIVGSGAGGAPAAYELARQGARVVVLEKGRELAPAEMIHDEIRVCRRNLFVPYVRDEPHTIREEAEARAEKTAQGWTANVVGGATVHYSGYFFRMHPVDMRMSSTLGAIEGATLADWPISYDELEPYYARVEQELGVSGRARAHPFEEPRSTEYPLPPVAEDAIAQRIDRAAARLGYHTFPTPRAILSQPYRGRVACVYCSLCGSYGCEVGAKSSMAVSLLPAAVATGRCEDPPAVDGHRGAGGQGRTRDWSHLSRGLRRAPIHRGALRRPGLLGHRDGQVASAIAFAALSRGARQPQWAHRQESRLLGYGAWPGDVSPPATVPPISRFPFVQRSIQDFYFNAQGVQGVRKGGTILFDWAHPNPIFAAERVAHADGKLLFGRALKDKLRRDVAGVWNLQFEVFSEFLPTAGTYVDLDPDVKDRFGLPVARMTVRRHPADAVATGMLVDRGMAVLRDLEPDEWSAEELRGVTHFLQGGTCRFGNDPATSVLDPSCRAHEVANLYVTDGSFLPSSGGVPITLTIMANAFRVAERIAARLQAREW